MKKKEGERRESNRSFVVGSVRFFSNVVKESSTII